MDSFANLTILSQNVHKSGKTTKNLLEQHANSCDILFTQESFFSHIRKTTSVTSEEGDDVSGPPIHVAWQVIHFYGKHPNTQVCTYVNQRLLTELQISTDANLNTNQNVLIFALTGKLGGQSASFANIYNPPKTKDIAVKALLQLMPRVTNLRVLVGDFNVRSMDWEPSYPRSHELTSDILAACTLQSLTLVNNDGEPTWHHNRWGGSVLDLLFVSNTWLQHGNVVFENDSVNRGTSDHSILRLWLGHRVEHAGTCYIPKESGEEEAFVSRVQKALITAASAPLSCIQDTFDRLYNSFNESWTANAKTAKAGSNPTHVMTST